MRPTTSFRLSTIMVMAAWVASSAAAQPPVQEPREMVTRFVAAWNAHDPSAFGALMSTDADWVTASGIRLRGRESIQGYLAEEHATWAKLTSMRAMNIHLRLLSPTSVVLLFEWEISTPGEGERAPSIARGNNLFVVSDDKGWSIVAGQVARVRAQ